MNSDFKDLLKILAEFNVRYLIVGGYAYSEYAEPRYTKDLDLWVEASAANATNLFAALKAFGAPLGNLSEKDFSQEGYFYQMGVPPARVDILMSMSGVNFADAWPKRMEADFFGVPAYFIAKNDLILAKKAAARPQDLVDVQNLLETNETDDQS